MSPDSFRNISSTFPEHIRKSRTCPREFSENSQETSQANPDMSGSVPGRVRKCARQFWKFHRVFLWSFPDMSTRWPGLWEIYREFTDLRGGKFMGKWPEMQAGKPSRLGQPAPVTLPSYWSWKFPGHVRNVSRNCLRVSRIRPEISRTFLDNPNPLQN